MLDPESGVEISFSETNAMDAISKLLTENYNLAIIRIKDRQESSFMQLIREKDLKCEVLSEFKYRVLMSKKHRLADKSRLAREDLTGIEILWNDDSVFQASSDRQIRICDRAAQYELLSEIADSFMWTSPVAAEALGRYGLIERNVTDAEGGKYLLVYPKSHRLTKLDNMYLDELRASIKE